MGVAGTHDDSKKSRSPKKKASAEKGRRIRRGAFREKMEVIYLPFLFVLVTLVVLYTLAHWFFVIQTRLITLDKNILQFWLPLILTVAIVLFWLRPKVGVLKFVSKSNYNDPHFGFLMAATIVLSVPVIIAQQYMTTATGRLTHLNHISGIAAAENSKYYTVDDLEIDTTNWGLSLRTKLMGRMGNRLELSLYFAMPLSDSCLSANPTTSMVWLGLKYRKEVSRLLSDSAQNVAYNKLVHQSYKDILQKDIRAIPLFERIGPCADLDGFKDAVLRSGIVEESGDPIILIPLDNPYESRTGRSLVWLIGTFAGGALIWLAMVMVPLVDEEELKSVRQGRSSKDSDIRDAVSFMFLQGDYVATPLLIWLIIAIFGAQTASGFYAGFSDSDPLIEWGACNRQAILSGEWWRLITAMFLHGSFPHLINNLFGIVLAGLSLERLLKWRKFVLSFLVTGLIAGIVSLLCHADSMAIGASGGIFGMFGVLFSLSIPRHRRLVDQTRYAFYIAPSVVLTLVLGAVTPWIDNSAHVGGLVAGLLIGLYLRRGLVRRARRAGSVKTSVRPENPIP